MGTSLVHDAFASGSDAASANRHRDHADHAWAIVCDGECSCNRPFANTGGTTRGMSEYHSRLNVTLAGGFDSATLAKLIYERRSGRHSASRDRSSRSGQLSACSSKWYFVRFPLDLTRIAFL